MIRESITLTETIEFLNSLVKLDAKALGDLIEQRVGCNNELADHPTVQVQSRTGELDLSRACSVGLLGILNGLFGVDDKGWGPITAIFEDDGRLTGFRQTQHKAATP